MPVRFSSATLRTIASQKYFGIRAGSGDHRFIGIWLVAVEGRIFARSWTLKPSGWRATLQRDPRGQIQVGDRTIRVRARAVRSDRINDAVTDAYLAKYDTPASLVYCRGFARGRRRSSTVELLPA